MAVAVGGGAPSARGSGRGPRSTATRLERQRHDRVSPGGPAPRGRGASGPSPGAAGRASARRLASNGSTWTSPAIGPASSNAPDRPATSPPPSDDLDVDPARARAPCPSRAPRAAGPPRSRLARYVAGARPEVRHRLVEEVGGEQRLAAAEHEAEPARGRREVDARRPRASRGRAGRRRSGARAPSARRRRPARQSPSARAAAPRRRRGLERRVEAPVDPGQDPPARAGARPTSSRTRRTAWVSRASLRMRERRSRSAADPGRRPRASTSRASSARAIEAEKPSAAGRSVAVAAVEVERGARAEAGLRVGQAVDRPRRRSPWS